jgi:hypothetical protein
MLDFDQFGSDIDHAWQHRLVDEGKENQVLILAAFLITFCIVRLITHAIRAGRWKRVLHNVVVPGGTHFHHLVIGIVLLLVSGFIGIGLSDERVRHSVAIGFGAGAALTLDEFALWLHLEDVYWAREGRQTVDAVIIAATIVALGVLGNGFWIDIARATGHLIPG